ncbi:MAG: hypothetical protein ONB44_03715 [candidate division KSB1 bacterium]|nr:hypothetical protein [candidate division KSB1 bacterium]MDZ7301236.1 hypothetical protein [candidate division KSB1 bacterium]MDZ7310540.1 hypothetical protein [candidate division KSB1 bacterium]
MKHAGEAYSSAKEFVTAADTVSRGDETRGVRLPLSVAKGKRQIIGAKSGRAVSVFVDLQSTCWVRDDSLETATKIIENCNRKSCFFAKNCLFYYDSPVEYSGRATSVGNTAINCSVNEKQ